MNIILTLSSLQERSITLVNLPSLQVIEKTELESIINRLISRFCKHGNIQRRFDRAYRVRYSLHYPINTTRGRPLHAVHNSDHQVSHEPKILFNSNQFKRITDIRL